MDTEYSSLQGYEPAKQDQKVGVQLEDVRVAVVVVVVASQGPDQIKVAKNKN